MTMINESDVTMTPAPRTLAIRQQLEQAFACSLGIWSRPHRLPGKWSRLSGARSEHAGREHQLSESIGRWFDQLVAEASTEPQLLKLSDSQAMVAVFSESEEGEPEIVAGPVHLDTWRLAETAANLAVEQANKAENEKMLEHYATRLSASFEELSFLRRLSKHVDYCVADRSSAEVAASILPEMRQLLEVEALCLIKAGKEHGSQDYRAQSISGFAGSLPITESLCCQVVDCLGRANRHVLVKNYLGSLCGGDVVPAGLKSLVLAPIEKDGVLFGWLVGLNRQINNPLPSEPLHPSCQDEIGSMEATLLEASALILGSHANNHRLFQDLETLMVGITHTLVGAIEARDAYTSGHSDRVAMMGRRLATQLNLSSEQQQDIFLCGLLHDIGKIGIPDHILQKPGRLTEEEFAAIKTHPEIGARLLRGLKPLEKLLPGVMHHHESVDGSGYPHGLKGQEIPLMARILAVADAFDAMTSDRPYRDGMSLAKAETILRAGQGTQWDVEVVDAFFAAQADMERICEHYKKSPTPIPSNNHSQSTAAPLAVESRPPIESTIAASC